jgi:hypothetical protein
MTVSPPSARSSYPPPGAEGLASKIFVTPLVYSIAQRYFKSQLEMVGTKPKYFPRTPQARRKDPVITAPLNVENDQSDDGSVKYYPSIIFEEQHHYKVCRHSLVSFSHSLPSNQVGDYVATVIGNHKELEARSHPIPPSSNHLANNSLYNSLLQVIH